MKKDAEKELEFIVPPKIIRMVFPSNGNFPGYGPVWADFNQKTFDFYDYVLFSTGNEKVETSRGLYEKDIKGSLTRMENSSGVNRIMKILKYRLIENL